MTYLLFAGIVVALALAYAWLWALCRSKALREQAWQDSLRDEQTREGRDG